MQNTEGVHRPPLSQKAPAPIACSVFLGQKIVEKNILRIFADKLTDKKNFADIYG